MVGKLFLLVILMISRSLAIDFTTIGQKEIVDYIKNRADILYGTELNDRNLQDLLSIAVFTGLEEEATIFAFGKSANSQSDNPGAELVLRLTALVSDSIPESTPLKIFLTSDTMGSTNIQTNGLTTSKTSSSKQSVGDFVVKCTQEQNFDSTNLDGSITINYGGSTASYNLTLTKTIYLSAEINITSLGSQWDQSLVSDEGKLLSMLPSTSGSFYVVQYQSLIRETIQSLGDDLIGGFKTGGNVLIHKDSNGVISLAGRIISGKIEPTSQKDSEASAVDSFLTLNGAKSRRFFINDSTIKPKSSNRRSHDAYHSSHKSSSGYDHDNRGHQSSRHDSTGSYESSSSKHRQSSHKGSSDRYDSHREHQSSRHDSKGSYESSSSKHHQSSHKGSSDRYDGQRDHQLSRRDSDRYHSDSYYSGGLFSYFWNLWRQHRRPWYERGSTACRPWRPCAQEQSTTPKPSPSTTVTPSTPIHRMPSTSPVSSPEVAASTTSRPSTPVAQTTPEPEPELEVTSIESVINTVMTTGQPDHTDDVEVKSTEKPINLSEPELPPLPQGATVTVWSTRII